MDLTEYLESLIERTEKRIQGAERMMNDPKITLESRSYWYAEYIHYNNQADLLKGILYMYVHST